MIDCGCAGPLCDTTGKCDAFSSPFVFRGLAPAAASGELSVVIRKQGLNGLLAGLVEKAA